MAELGGNPFDLALEAIRREAVGFPEAVRHFQRAYLLRELAHQGGNQCRTAAAIGIHRETLRKMFRQLGVTRLERMSCRPYRARRKALPR